MEKLRLRALKKADPARIPPPRRTILAATADHYQAQRMQASLEKAGYRVLAAGSGHSVSSRKSLA
jgi:hypothetical protein